MTGHAVNPTGNDSEARKPLTGLTREELREEMRRIGQNAYRADQIFQWIYARGADSFDAMTNIRKDLRAELAGLFRIESGGVENVRTASDGTKKFLLRLPDGAKVESVLIPEPGRLTICVSTQVGCSLNCRFCRTGTMRLERQLAAWEIVEQIRAARREVADRDITNVVFMGMGEPLLNYDATVAAARILTDDLGMNFSNRRVTISTAGIVPAIRRLGQDTDVSLAISLHATDDDTRSRLMPINKKHPIGELLAACRDYPLSNRRRITYEYTLLDGVNDRDEDARRLIRLMAPLKAHVNLICFNPWPGSPYAATPEARVRAFQRILLNARINCVVRRSRGQDILAACGQLRSADAAAQSA